MNAEATPQTPSPLCNRILDMLRRVKDGEAPAQELRDLASEKLAQLPDVREKTLASIRAMGEEHLRRFGDQIGALQDSWVDMEGALREAIRFAETGQEPVYVSAVERLKRAGYSQQAASDGYQQAELAQGPTEMPLLNLIHRLTDGFFAGTVQREVMDQGIDGAIRMARSAAEEVRNNEPVTETKENLARAYEIFAGALERVAAAVEMGAPAVKEALAQAQDSGRNVRGAMEEFTFQATTSAPTRMAHANLILTLAETHHKGQLPGDTVSRGIEIFRKSLEDLKAEIESLASIPTESGRIAEQMEPTRRAFEEHFEALDLLERWLAGEADMYEPGRQRLIAAAEALADCKETFEGIGEMEGKVPCLRCGAPNEPTNRSCARCGAQLIVPTGMAAASSTMSFQEQGGQATMTGDLVMTENLMRVFETVNRMSEGRLGAHEFEEVLDWFEGLVRDNLLGLAPAPELSREGLTPEQAEQVDQAEQRMVQAREDIEVGAQELLEAMATLRGYLDEPDSRHLVNGVRMVRDASVKIQQAQGLIDELAQASKGATSR